jgi:ABC-type sulfate transport system permease component
MDEIALLTAGISALAAIVGVVIGSIVSFLIAKQQFKAKVI